MAASRIMSSSVSVVLVRRHWRRALDPESGDEAALAEEDLVRRDLVVMVVVVGRVG